MWMSPHVAELLSVLTAPVRLISDHQVGRTWFASTASPTANARRLLTRLAAEGLLHVYRAPAHPELPLEVPIISWSPGEDTPALGHAAYLLSRRWTKPPVLTTCACATRTAANLFSGRGKEPREVERTHDLHLTAVYLRLRRVQPEDARFWISEDTIRRERERQNERLPDAIIRRPGTWPRVVEFGGAYKKRKLEAFHDYCFENALPYEIW